MSDDQTGQPNDREPTPERQAEVRAAYDKNVAEGRAPYQNVQIRTRGELNWVLQERGWSVELFPSASVSRPDLSGVDLHGLDLSGILLPESTLRGAMCNGTDLSGAYLADADLSGAHLSMCTLVRATLSDARLKGANLGKANLRDAFLVRTDLSNADLSFAKLTGADLVGANLTGALLFGAHLDAETILASVVLDATTRVADVVWDGAVLARVEWIRLPKLGDELLVADAKSPSEKARAFRVAARAYRGLAITLRSQGLLIPASHYRLREQELERQALRLERKPFAWLFSALLDLVAGYGERPARTVLTYLAAILGFACAYYVLGQQVGPALPPLGALVLSVTSFHGRGFFPGSIPSLADPLVVLAAGEAIIGLFIELVFIATFSRRFLGD